MMLAMSKCVLAASFFLFTIATADDLHNGVPRLNEQRLILTYSTFECKIEIGSNNDSPDRIAEALFNAFPHLVPAEDRPTFPVKVAALKRAREKRWGTKPYPRGGAHQSETRNGPFMHETRDALMATLEMKVQRRLSAPLLGDAKVEECDEGSSFEEWASLRTSFLPMLDAEVVDVPCGMLPSVFMKLVEILPCIAHLSFDHIREPFPAAQVESHSLPDHVGCSSCLTPADPRFREQWHLLYHYVSSLDAQRGWKAIRDKTGRINGSLLAVLDTGFSHHEDLRGAFYENPGEICDDGIDNDGNGFIDDCQGWDFGDGDNDPFDEPDNSIHGTPVTGVVAARHNDVSVAGVCPDCKVLPVKIYSSKSRGISVASTVEAINYLIVMDIKLSVNSYGGYGKVSSEYDAIRRLGEQGHLFVAAAGNDACDLDSEECIVNGSLMNITKSPYSPGGYDLDCILTVGASDKRHMRSSFSNYGAIGVDIFAPGSDIVTLYNPARSETAVMQGTSFAVPQVAGIAAILMSLHPNMTSDAVKTLIMQTYNQEIGNLKEQAVAPGVASLFNAASRALISWDGEMEELEDSNSGAASLRFGFVFSLVACVWLCHQ